MCDESVGDNSSTTVSISTGDLPVEEREPFLTLLYCPGITHEQVGSRLSLEYAMVSHELDRVGRRSTLFGLGLNDAFLSNPHFAIVNYLGHHRIRDLGSKNGTDLLRVDKTGEWTRQRVEMDKKRVQLRDGDVIRAGGLFMLYEEANPELDVAPTQEVVRSGKVEVFITCSEPMRRLWSELEEVAAGAEKCILVEGETRTGKDFVAHILAQLSETRGNLQRCSLLGLPENLIESELFGHERGAFTSADSAWKGLFRLADGGTLFLDELGRAPLPVQERLQEAIDPGVVRPIKGEAIPVDVRVVMATSTPLQTLLREGKLRRDLFFRKSRILKMAPLRERPADLLVFTLLRLQALHAEESAAGAQDEETEPLKPLHPKVVQALLEYRWPGNLGQLSEAVGILYRKNRGQAGRTFKWPKEPMDEFKREAQHAYCRPVLDEEHGGRGLDTPIKERLWSEKLEALKSALRRNNGNRAATARDLRISRTHLYKWLERLNTQEPDGDF